MYMSRDEGDFWQCMVKAYRESTRAASCFRMQHPGVPPDWRVPSDSSLAFLWQGSSS